MARIEVLNLRDAALAGQVHRVWTAAYRQEAELLRGLQGLQGLQVEDFAPLQRSVADLQASTDFVLGALADGQVLGVLCLGPDDEAGQLCINALVVDPAAQRGGVGRALVQEALRRCAGFTLAVSTAAANAPALALYRGAGFEVYRRGCIGPQSLPLLKLRRRVDGEVLPAPRPAPAS